MSEAQMVFSAMDGNPTKHTEKLIKASEFKPRDRSALRRTDWVEPLFLVEVCFEDASWKVSFESNRFHSSESGSSHIHGQISIVRIC